MSEAYSRLDMTLIERLYALYNREAIDEFREAADALDAQDKRIKELEGALRELSAMYSHAWDTVDGDLLMMSGSIPRFEAAHKRAEDALK